MGTNLTTDRLQRMVLMPPTISNHPPQTSSNCLPVSTITKMPQNSYLFGQ